MGRFDLVRKVVTHMRAGALLIGLAAACTNRPASTDPSPPPTQVTKSLAAPQSQAKARIPDATLPDPAPTPAPRQPKSSRPEPFPEDLSLHHPDEVAVAGDRNLRIAHAPHEIKRAIVYLHGMCGNSKGADPWIDIATNYATVVTVRANVPCPDRPGYKWPQEASEIQPRIEAALALVRKKRGGHLETDQVTLIGYSQGAHRAEKLAAAFPERYRYLVLGGAPTAPDPMLLRQARGVAILGGELEDTMHMMEGYRALKAAGIRAQFFMLPHAHHGDYGPQGRRVMTEVLSWLWAHPD